MNPALFILIYLPIIIMLLNQRNINKKVIIDKIKNKKGDNKMKEIVKEYIGEKCTVTTINSGFGVTGVIEKVIENAVVIKSGRQENIVNIDYIINIIRVVPKEKKVNF